jgi:hypothetical protein
MVEGGGQRAEGRGRATDGAFNNTQPVVASMAHKDYVYQTHCRFIFFTVCTIYHYLKNNVVCGAI